MMTQCSRLVESSEANIQQTVRFVLQLWLQFYCSANISNSSLNGINCGCMLTEGFVLEIVILNVTSLIGSA